MPATGSSRWFTLLQRELQEYKLSLLVTPLVIALVLSLLMLGSVLLANRITVMGDTFLHVIATEEGMQPVLTINLGDDDESPAALDAQDSAIADLEIETPGEALEESEWNFSREWRFEPDKREKPAYETREVGSLNPVLNMMHYLMLIVLLLVTTNYLLGCLYNDRKDRSILFWKSMPVSEWEEVLARFAVAVIVAPAVYIAVSLLTQMIFVLLAMLLVWRLEMDPYETILSNLQFGDLLLQQLGGWLVTVLLLAPAYGWLMLASAWAKRSPFMVALAPVIGLMLLEGLMLGTDYVLSAVKNHMPHYMGGESAVGFYFDGLYWAQFDYAGVLAGLVFAALTITASVYLRRYRFEI